MLRHRCRNPRCAGKLKEPTDNKREAFCCEKREGAFYKERCRVCEAAISKKTARREVCWRSKCRHEYQRFPERFSVPATPTADLGQNGQKTSKISTPKTGAKIGRGYRIVAGPPCHEANLWADPNASVAKAERSTAPVLIGPTTPPINIIGGYKFPDAPTLDRDRLKAVMRWR
jgi:hypothetical protein